MTRSTTHEGAPVQDPTPNQPQPPVFPFGATRPAHHLVVTVPVTVQLEIRYGRPVGVSVAPEPDAVRVVDRGAETELTAEELTSLLQPTGDLDPYARSIDGAVRAARRIASEHEFTRDVLRAGKGALARNAL